MSDFLRSALGSTFGDSPLEDSLGGSVLNPKPPTAAQQQLMPYIAEEKDRDERKRKRIQPLKMLFDLLQRGQYMSANAVDEVWEAVETGQGFGSAALDTLKGIWEGATGERKGSYTDIFENRTEWGAKKLFDDREGKFLGNTTWGDILGTIADIALDPLTYVGGAGPSKLARSAAREFAEDSARVTILKMGDDLSKLQDLAKGVDEFGQKFSLNTFKNLLQKSPDDGVQYLSKYGTDVSKYFNKTYKEAYQKALRTPADQLRNEFAEDLMRLTDQAEAARIARGGPQTATPGFLRTAEEMADPIAEALEKRYVGAGQRAVQGIFGKERFVGERNPITQKAWDSLRRNIEGSGPGKAFEKAWWSITNNGLVGRIRKDLNLLNPWETMLRKKELREGGEKFVSEIGRRVRDVYKSLDGYSQEAKDHFVLFNDMAERARGFDGRTTVFDIIANKKNVEGMSPELVQETIDVAQSARGLLKNWNSEYNEWAAKGLVDPQSGEIVNYLPTWIKDPNSPWKNVRQQVGPDGKAKAIGTSKPGHAYTRGFERYESAQNEAEKFMFLFGLSREDAINLVQNYNLSGFSMDLDELLMMRAYTQAKTATRVNMVEQFREFGIRLDQLPENLQAQISRGDALGQIKELGLKSIQTKGLEGYVFDDAVSEVFERAAGAVNDPSGLERMVNAFTSWWKGIVTMTTGFHARNHISNQITGFMKEGAEWFSVERQRDALVGVIYALRSADPRRFLDEMGLDESIAHRILQKRYGGRTVKELAEEARDIGVISEATHGFDVQSAVDKIFKGKDKVSANPLSKRFVGRDLSYKAGSYVENTPKFQSFLMDYADTAGKGAGHEAAVTFAEQEAKKWWIDYNDLTAFEQRTLKNVLPFYTWLRHNVSNQIAGVVAYPQMFSLFPKITEAMTYDDPEFDPDIMPDWMKQLGMFPVGRLETGNLAFFNPNVPYQDINKIPLLWEEGRLMPVFDPQELKDDIINMMHPAVKTAVNLMTEKGYDFFYKNELTDTRKAPYLFRLFASNPRMLGTLDGIARAAGMEDGIKAYVDHNGKLQMDGKMAKLLEDNLPLLRHIDYMFYGAQTLIPGLEEALEAATGAEDDYEGIEQIFQVLAFYGGLKFKQLDVEDAKRDIARTIYETADDRRRTANRRTAQGTSRSLKATEDYNRRVRRVTGI